MQAFESEALDVPNFHLTGDDYQYRFDIEAKERFIRLLRERFNSGVKYKDRVLKWDTVIEHKTLELSRFLNDKSRDIDFTEPSPILERSDNDAIRKRILSLTQQEAGKLRIGKSTLHDLRLKAKNKATFTMYSKVMSKLDRFPI